MHKQASRIVKEDKTMRVREKEYFEEMHHKNIKNCRMKLA